MAGTLDYSAAGLDDIVGHVAKQGSIEGQGIEALHQRFIQDGVVSRAEAECLFELHGILAGRDVPLSDEFCDLFVNGIISHVLNSGDTPAGILDDFEWIWLKDLILNDLHFDSVEARLLTELADQAQGLPASFHQAVTDLEEEAKARQAEQAEAESHEQFSFVENLKTAIFGK